MALFIARPFAASAGVEAIDIAKRLQVSFSVSVIVCFIIVLGLRISQSYNVLASWQYSDD